MLLGRQALVAAGSKRGGAAGLPRMVAPMSPSRSCATLIDRRLSVACAPSASLAVSVSLAAPSASLAGQVFSQQTPATGTSGRPAAAPYRVKDITPERFYELAEACESLYLVDFYMDLCGPCQIMHKELERIADAFPTVAMYKLNSGKFDKDFTTRQRVRAMPTIKVYYKGKCLDELVGAKPVALRQMLSELTFRFAQ